MIKDPMHFWNALAVVSVFIVLTVVIITKIMERRQGKR